MLSDASAQYDRLVKVNFTVSDLQVVITVGICANPRLVMNCGTLSTKIREGDQSTLSTTNTIWPNIRFQLLTLLQRTFCGD